MSSTNTPATEIYALSLHDALPISGGRAAARRARPGGGGPDLPRALLLARGARPGRQPPFRARPDAAQRGGSVRPARPLHARSEEHTSELQSHSDLVCRLLLEKKKT